MVVEHASDAIEAKAVEIELVDPVAGVGEKKVEDFRFTVVEAAGVPSGVVTAFTGMKILIGVPSKRESPSFSFLTAWA